MYSQRWSVHATPVVSTLALMTLGVFDDTVSNSPRVVWQLHLYWVEQRLFERDRPLRGTCAKSVTMVLRGNVEHCQLFGAEPHSRIGENTCRST